MHSRFALAGLLMALLCHPGAFAATHSSANTAALAEPEKAEDPFAALKFRLIGPAAGGRISKVFGVRQDANVLYAAAAQGGVWKSSNGGFDWKPIFDDQATQSIGAMAIADSDPNVIYVGSGEANIRGNVALGYGIWKSTDAGQSFKQVLKLKGQIGQIAIDRKDANIVFAAVLGSPFGPGRERGIYKSVDGGANWQQVLYLNPDTGASDVAISAQNSRVVFAGLWQTRRSPWSLTSGGPGSGLYHSTDAGATFTEVTGAGLPEKPYGKIGVAVAPSDGNRIYALIEAKAGGLFRSDDGGASFTRVNAHRALRQRAWYYSTIVVDPNNPDVVWFPQVNMLKSVDGGKTIVSVNGFSHGDHHDIWLDPNNKQRLLAGNDGGIELSQDGGKTWFKPNLPLAQFYNIDVDNRKPYHVGGTIQDMGTASGPSAAYRNTGVKLSDWRYAGGGEAGDFVYDPFQAGVAYAGEYSGYLSQYDEGTGQVRTISPYLVNASGRPAAELSYRFQWTSPTLASLHQPGVLYHAGNVLFKSTDHGASFLPISPDLSRNDKSKQAWSGGPITGDITTVETFGTIFSLAESPKKAGVLWAGTDDGLLHLSQDDGKTWRAVTPKGLPTWATIECIQADPNNSAAAWVVAHNYRLDDHAPYLYYTDDYGQSWTRLGKDLASDLTLWAVRVDPEDTNYIYLGTQRGLWFSDDRGQSFRQLKSNLPNVTITDLETKHGDLILATRGRSIWALENLAQLRALKALDPKKMALLAPNSGTRLFGDQPWEGSNDGDVGNREFGVTGFYWLANEIKRAPGHKQALLKLEVFAPDGTLVRTLTDVPRPVPYQSDDPDEPSKAKEPELSLNAGLNYFVWDLSTDGVKRLTNTKYDSGDAEDGPMALPGTYTLKLSAGQQVVSQTAQVLPDPRSKISPTDLRANDQFARATLAELNHLVDLINAVRALRAQLKSQLSALPSAANGDAARQAGQALALELEQLENAMHNPKAKVVYDILAGRDGGAKLYHQLAPLYYAIVATEHKPTLAMQENAKRLQLELAAIDQRYAQMLLGNKAKYDSAAKVFGGGLINPLAGPSKASPTASLHEDGRLGPTASLLEDIL